MAGKPFALVQYKVDSKTLKVPQSYIEDFDPLKWTPGQEANVFWSPKSAETPTDIIRSQGTILHLDDEVDDRRGKSEDELAGYYKAKILKIADSETELDKATSSRRVRVPTDKLVLANANKKSKKNSKKEKISDQSSYVSKDKTKKIIKRSDSITSSKWKEKYGAAGSESSDTDPDDILMTKKDIRYELQRLEQRNSTLEGEKKELKKKLQEMEKKLQELEALNIYWQKKYLSQSSPQKHHPIDSSTPVDGVNTVRKKLFNQESNSSRNTITASPGCKWIVSPPSKRQRSVSPPNPNQRWEEVLSPAEKTPIIQATSPSIKDQEKFNTMNSSRQDDTVSMNEQSGPSPSEKSGHSKQDNGTPTEKSFEFSCLTPNKAAMALSGVKSGKKGDTLYAKQLAMAIFGPELLMRSSFSGKAALGGKKKLKDKEARPALPSKGLEELKAAFKKRMLKGNPDLDPTEESERMLCIRDAISDKIKYLRTRAALD